MQRKKENKNLQTILTQILSHPFCSCLQHQTFCYKTVCLGIEEHSIVRFLGKDFPLKVCAGS